MDHDCHVLWQHDLRSYLRKRSNMRLHYIFYVQNPAAFFWSYLRPKRLVEGFAQLLERMGVDTEVIRGPKDGIVSASKTPPGNLTRLRNGQGWRDSEGNEWKLDKLHEDHWDVTDPKTRKKVNEVDFEGKQIWPDGAKNKNKR